MSHSWSKLRQDESIHVPAPPEGFRLPENLLPRVKEYDEDARKVTVRDRSGVVHGLYSEVLLAEKHSWARR